MLRYDIQTPPDLLIVDEIESILERLYICVDSEGIWLKFLKLIECAKNIVFMDGLIERKTIEYLNTFRGCSTADVVLNNFSPRADY